MFGASTKSSSLFITKTLRVFAYSFISIILPVYLVKLGYSSLFVGLVVTLTVGSSVIYNLLVSKYSDLYGRGKSLVILALLMALSGTLFALNLNIYSLILAALIGSISVTSSETGPFMNIEQASLTKFMDKGKRTSMYGFYNFLGYAAASFGALFSGLPAIFNNSVLGMQILFYTYAVIGFMLAFLYAALGNSLEIKVHQGAVKKLSKSTKERVTRLSILFSLDAFGGGLIIQSLLVLWFFSKWNLQLSSLSVIFFVSSIITAFSIFLSVKIARRIGLLNTMVFTHIPSSLFLIAIPFAPSALLAVLFLFLRQSISQMDVPARQSYVMAIVNPSERTAAGSLTNTPRALAQSVSPLLSSYMIQVFAYQLPFVIGGSLKIICDVAIFFMFRKVKPPEERKTKGILLRF